MWGAASPLIACTSDLEDVTFKFYVCVQLEVGVFRAVTGFSVSASASYAALCKNV